MMMHGLANFKLDHIVWLPIIHSTLTYKSHTFTLSSTIVSTKIT